MATTEFYRLSNKPRKKEMNNMLNGLNPVFQQALRGYIRPDLNQREAELLKALQLMKGWVVHFTEPHMSGTPQYPALARDLRSAEIAISNATNGNEQ